MNTLAELDTESSELDPVLDFAVIGAGISGLTAASKINDLGFIVGVFEKARGTGGRMSSKRVAGDDQYMAFDLGCTSITAQSAEFANQLKSWNLKGVLAPWWENYHGLVHYVGVPRNSSLTRHLSKNLECHFGKKVIAIEKVEDVWHLFTAEKEEGIGNGRNLLARAKTVIIATPPAQAQDLLPSNSSLKDQLDKVQVSPQWVMAVEVDSSLSGLPNIQYPQNDIIFSISQENYKPGRSQNKSQQSNVNGTTVLQIQATANWTHNHLELSSEQISDMLVDELERHLGQSLNIVNCYAHRWLYSCVTQGVNSKEGYLWDKNGIGLIGDYINSDGEHDGVESAWLSGKQLAEWITLNGQR
jgi:renalase